MARRGKVEILKPGVAKLLNEPAVTAKLHELAGPILARAKSIARAEAYDTGDYHDSLAIEQVSTDRNVVRVAASDKKAHIIESRVGVLVRAAGPKAVKS